MYYQHADNLHHQRQNVFIVAQSIFFAAFTQSPTALRSIVAVLGVVYSVLWWYLAERLSDGMDALNKFLRRDDVYRVYLSGLRRKKKISGRCILNKMLPLLTLVGWLALAVAMWCGLLEEKPSIEMPLGATSESACPKNPEPAQKASPD